MPATPGLKPGETRLSAGAESRYGEAGSVSVNAIALGTVAITWFIGRTRLTGREVSATAHKLVLAKDILIGAALATGVANGVAGYMLSKQAPDGAVPIESGTKPAPETPKSAAQLRDFLDILGNINLGLVASINAITTILATQSGRSSRWAFNSRFLP